MTGDDPVLTRVCDEWPDLTVLNARVWREYVRGGQDSQVASTLEMSAKAVRRELGDLFYHLPCPNDRVSLAMYGLRTRMFSLVSFSQDQMTRPLEDFELNYVQAAADGLTNRAIGSEYHRTPRSISNSLYTIGRVVGATYRVQIATRCWRARLIA